MLGLSFSLQVIPKLEKKLYKSGSVFLASYITLSFVIKKLDIESTMSY